MSPEEEMDFCGGANRPLMLTFALAAFGADTLAGDEF